MNESTKIDKVKTLPLGQVRHVRELLMNDAARGQLASVAARHMNPERMMRVVANAIRTTPQLSECEPMSMLGALMTCASLGLEPNTPLGHAYLIPFKNNKKGVTEVQLIVGYKGFADLARRSGQIVSLHADVVYSDDEFWSYEYGTDMHLRHKPGPRQGVKTHAYCHVKLKDGEAFVVLPWQQIIKTRDNSQGWKTAVRFGKTAEAPWTKYEDRMAAKTAVRALANAGELPLSIEFMEAMDVDEAKADFRGVAFDPTAGVTIDGEADDITEDGEVIQGGGASRQAKDEAKAPSERKPEPGPQQDAKPQSDEASKPQQSGLDLPGPQEGSAPKVSADRARYEALAEMMIADLDEGTPAVVLASYEPQMAQLARHFPDLHKKVTAAAAEATKSLQSSTGSGGTDE
jgi:recombination protein RecT